MKDTFESRTEMLLHQLPPHHPQVRHSLITDWTGPDYSPALHEFLFLVRTHPNVYPELAKERRDLIRECLANEARK